jgi:catechol 2,3-dioxygenase-like lactoylglutathione lyase family enzyme
MRRQTASAPHLTHVALWAADVERSVDFYRRHCDLRVVHDRVEPDGGRVVWVGEHEHRSRFVIVLISRPATRAARSSFAHFGFSCSSRREVDSRAAVARSEGVLELEPRDAGPIVGYFCMLRDPDGNAVELSFGQALGSAPARSRRKVRALRRRLPSTG